jgi:glycosyltransferase involved in cell wall biosynthesis
MRVALIVPGFSANEADWCIPALLNFARALSQQVELEIFTLRYPHQRGSYRIGNAAVYSLGWAQRRGLYSPLLWLAAIRAIKKRHRQAPFDCLHAFWADETGWIGAVCAQQLGLPLVVSLADGELSNLPGVDYGLQRHATQRPLIRKALNAADLVTAGSRYLLDLARPHVTGSRRLLLAPLGVDCDMFTPAGRAPLPTPGVSEAEPVSLSADSDSGNSHFSLINVGSLAAIKGQSLLLRAMQHVVAELPGAYLRIVGEGPLDGALRCQIADLGLTERVTLDGAVAHDRLPAIFRTADLFVQTSLHEAQGMAVLEAAACGIPAIGTGVGVLPELALQAASAVTPCDEQALAGTLVALLCDPGRRLTMAQAARDAVLHTYCVDTCVARFLAGYAGIA